MLRIAVLDDDIGYSLVINSMIKQVCEESDLEFMLLNFNEKAELFKYFDTPNSRIDILVLDVVLGEQNGIDVAYEINQKYPRTKIIYLTSYSQYSADISDTDFVYFLIKPINEEKLKNALFKAKSIIDEENESLIWYSYYGQLRSLNVNDIKYLESDAHYVHIFFDDGTETVISGRLNDLEERFREMKKFLRIHQSYLVNMDKIVNMSNTHVTLIQENYLAFQETVIITAKLFFMTL